MGEYSAQGVETAMNVVGPDGWRERVVPDYQANGEYGPNFTDDWFAFDAQGSVAERARMDGSQYCDSPYTGGNAAGTYVYDESAYDAWGNRLMDQTPVLGGDDNTENALGLYATILPSDTAGYEAQYGYQTDTALGLVLAGQRWV